MLSLLVFVLVSAVPWWSSTAAESRLMLLANRRDIRAVDLDKNLSRIVVDKTNEAVALSFIHSTGTLFWVEVGTKLIVKAPMPSIYGSHSQPSSSNTHEVIVRGNLGQVDGIACDWIGMKIYWTDSTLHRIEVADVAGKYRKVLLWTDMELPRSIAVVADRGLMFWTDWGEKSKIERASMDGTDRTVIVTEDRRWPNGLAVDPVEPRLYYSDAKVSTLYSVDFYGNNRVTVQKYEGHPYSVVVMDSYIYWTDWQTSSIYTTLKGGSGSMRKALQDSHLTALDIKFYSASQQKSNISSACNENNGGCSDLCLLSSKYPGMSCACPTGVRLQDDQKTCEPDIGNMFLVARKVDIGAISLDTADHTIMSLPLQGVKHAVAVDYDPVEEFIFWSDDQTKSINRARLNGAEQETVINKDIFVPDGIAVDSIARNIYFTDAEAGRILVATLNGKHRKTIISTGLRKPRGIAVDSKRGWLYWTDWGLGIVERAHLDGTNRQMLVNTTSGWPNGIALDLEKQKVYWGDGKLGHIGEANLDGTGKAIVIDKISHIFGLSLYRGYLYWSEWKLSRLERLKLDTQEREIIAASVADIMLLWAGTTRTHNNIDDNPCSNGGGCSHLCLNTPNGKVCACPDNMAVTEDGASCELEKPQLLVMSPDGRFMQAAVNSNNTLVNDHSAKISEVQAVGPIDYYWQEKSLFFVDSIQKVIYRTYLERPGRVEAVIKNGIERVSGIAVDWLSGNLYWTDLDLERIEISRLNGAHRRVLLWRETKPTLLVVDPLSKYIFWVDTYQSPRIERCRLDGSRRNRIVEIKARARALSLDPIDKKLYWSDGESIESIEVNGKSKRALSWSNKMNIVQMAVHGNKLFLSNGSLILTSPANRADQTTKLWQNQGNRDISEVKVMHSPSPLAWNHCALSNGECQALCLAAPSKDKPYYCSCGTHYVLDNENKCILPRHMLLFAQKSSISRILLQSESPDITLPIPVRNIRSLHFDPYTGHIYWIETYAEQIYRSKDDGTDYGPAFKPPNNESRLVEFAMDPVTGQLFWICEVRNTINVARMMPQGNFKQLGVIAALEKPRYLAAHHQKSLLVFTNANPNSIMSCGYDGSNLRTLLNIGDKVRAIGDLVIDTDRDLIYWSDTTVRKVETVTLDGERNPNFLRDVEANALAIYDDRLIVLSRKAHKVSTYNKLTGKEMGSIVSRRSHLYDIFASSSLLPAFRPKECPCSHICLVHGEKDLKFSCSCPARYAEGSCDVALCTTNEFTCKSGAIRCVSLEARCDGRYDCADRSDETDCCSIQTNFKCGSNSSMCISHKKVCDGHIDCYDGLDEKDCDLECNEDHCCPTGGFRCQKAHGKNACLPPDKICNSESDCSDRTDELSCCGPGLFQCHNPPECIDASKVCDGILHCADTSDEFSCCNDNCRTPVSGTADVPLATSESARIRWLTIMFGVIVIVIIIAGLFLSKREQKLPYESTMQYQAHSQVVTAPMMPMPMMKGPPAPSSATSSDPKAYPQNPPPSPATVQSYDYFYNKTLQMRSGASSTCSSSQLYNGSEASFLGAGHRTRNRMIGSGFSNNLRAQRPNTPCSTDVCDEFDALYHYTEPGYVPPPASPIPTEKSFLYSDPPPSLHEPRFV